MVVSLSKEESIVPRADADGSGSSVGSVGQTPTSHQQTPNLFPGQTVARAKDTPTPKLSSLLPVQKTLAPSLLDFRKRRA